MNVTYQKNTYGIYSNGSYTRVSWDRKNNKEQYIEESDNSEENEFISGRTYKSSILDLCIDAFENKSNIAVIAEDVGACIYMIYYDLIWFEVSSYGLGVDEENLELVKKVQHGGAAFALVEVENAIRLRESQYLITSNGVQDD